MGSKFVRKVSYPELMEWTLKVIGDTDIGYLAAPKKYAKQAEAYEAGSRAALKALARLAQDSLSKRPKRKKGRRG